MPTLCFESFFASSAVLWIDGDTSLSSNFCSIQQMAFMTLRSFISSTAPPKLSAMARHLKRLATDTRRTHCVMSFAPIPLSLERLVLLKYIFFFVLFVL